MPFNMRVTENRGMPPVRPRTAGGYERASVPNPNDPMEIYKRSHGNIAGGTYGSSQMPEVNAPNPLFTGTGGSALGENISRAARGREHRQQYAAGETERRAQAGNTGIAAWAPIDTVGKDPKTDALLQALYEAGTDELQTGAAAGWQGRGFYDLQTPGQAQAYNPAEAQVGGFAGSPTNQAMGRLQGRSAYDPQASRRALGALRGLYQGYGVQPGYDIFRR